MELYNELSRYVIHQYNKALAQNNNRNFVFALLLLQRRMASSIYALLKSLKRKKIKYEEIVKNPNLLIETRISFHDKDNESDLERWEDESELERWEKEYQLETSAFAANLEELKEEIKTLEKLIVMSESILDSGNETKLQELKIIMEKVGDEKVLIFSEAKDTVDYLIDKMRILGLLSEFYPWGDGHGSKSRS